MEKEELENCGHSCDSCTACGHDHEGTEIPEGMSPIITLTAEDGTEVKFEIIDVVALDEKEYLIAAEADTEETDDVEVTILEIKEEDGEEVYDTVVDEKVAEKVFNEFQKQQEEM